MQTHAASRYRVVMTVSDAIMPIGMSLAGFLTCAHAATPRYTAASDAGVHNIRHCTGTRLFLGCAGSILVDRKMETF